MGEPWYEFAIEEIEHSGRHMTAWEREFIQSIKGRIKAGMYLSDKLEAKLLEIHRKMTDVSACLR